MPRGSMPGERRGGRTRATPNRRTILADRIMAALDGRSTASPKERLSKLIDDAELPADIRMEVAQNAFSNRVGGGRRGPRAIEAPSATSRPVETMSQATRDALLGIASDPGASAEARRKAAMKLATYFLPMKPVNKRWRFTEDACGFAINGEIAREYRALDLELRDLKRHPNRDFPEISQRIRDLQARLHVIRHRLQCPPPEGYGDKEFSEDCIRLELFARKRDAGIALSPDEDAEEAHCKARFDCYADGPEQTARRRRQHLKAADILFRKGRFLGVGRTAPLSRKERNDLWLLRWLYPAPHRKGQLSAEPDGVADGERWIESAFHDGKPAVDGNFYPHDSKLRPARYYEIEIIDDEEVEIPPYYICNSGQPPYFTYELPNHPSSEKSDPSQPSS
jgi:hypothetical protein